MAKPSEKSEKIEAGLDKLASSLFGRSRTFSVRSDVCVTCGGEATEFKDALSRKEFGISGMCQKCQDDFFGG